MSPRRAAQRLLNFARSGRDGISEYTPLVTPDSWCDLMQRARAGESGAIDALLARHVGALRAHVRSRMGRLLRARESSADLVQSICRELLADLPRFEPRHEAGFRNWLLRRAERKLGKRVRYWMRERRDATREQPLDASRAGDPAARGDLGPLRHAVAHEDVERFERAFASLSPREAQVVLLVRCIGLPHAEVAARLGTTEPATWTLLHRALAKLSTRLMR
jgi:RNA polymerase sigma factor (sigma-70 family)